MKIISLLALTIFFVETGVAGTCQVDDARVVEVFQYDNGQIFVKLDQSDSDCVCTYKNRFRYHKDDEEKFFTASALSALAGNFKVKARGDDSLCGSSENTAKLTAIYLYAN